MAGSRRDRPAEQQGALPVEDYRHPGVTRPNNPPAAIAAEGRTPPAPRITYAYSPRLDPGIAVRLHRQGGRAAAAVGEGNAEKLTAEEAALLAAALRQHEPWLEWAGKREMPGFAVDPVALHIHERVSTQAILRAAARQDVTRDLFADPALSYAQAVRFYQHDMDWANRLILGDSLQVMASLAQRENLAGKVQMIYLDPPYGIRFGSNFQPETDKRNVTDREADLTREPEVVRAYRDTWRLGVHSYLAYLRDRLIVARTLLADTGSVFVQIGEENIHRVRALIDEVFKFQNFVSLISFQTTSGFAETGGLSRMGDYLLWYGRDREKTTVRAIYERQNIQAGTLAAGWLITAAGDYRGVSAEEEAGRLPMPDGAKLYKPDNIQSQGAASTPQPFTYEGKVYNPGANNHWKPNYPLGLTRLAGAGRLHVATDSIQYTPLLRRLPSQGAWESLD